MNPRPLVECYEFAAALPLYLSGHFRARLPLGIADRAVKESRSLAFSLVILYIQVAERAHSHSRTFVES